MANSLGRDLKRGDKIVFQNGQIGICGGQCFGSFSFTSGTALDVTINGHSVKANGYDIDAEATVKKFAKDNEWEDT
jgi:hypothetical protein